MSDFSLDGAATLPSNLTERSKGTHFKLDGTCSIEY